MKDTLKKIDETVARINTHPEYSSVVSQRFYRYLRAEAERHSVNMELTGEADLSNSELEKGRVRSLENLDNARKFLGKEGINLYSLPPLGNLIEPKKNPHRIFRRKAVTFGEMFDPPSFKILEQEANNLLYVLNECDDFHPVVRASLAHLGMVQIHPYNDGNGRAARLLQNLCLEQRGLPPAIIPVEDSEVYKGFMTDVLRDRYARRSDHFNQSEAEKRFHTYIASKVFISANALENELKSQRQYDLDLSGIKDINILNRVANSIRDIGRATEGSHVKVKSVKPLHRKRANYSVSGNVGEKTIVERLERLKSKYGFRYEINVQE